MVDPGQSVPILLVEDDDEDAAEIKRQLELHIRGVVVTVVRSESSLLAYLADLPYEDRPKLAVVDMLVRWAAPNRHMQSRPPAVIEGGVANAGLRCSEYLREAWGVDFPVVFNTVLPRQDFVDPADQTYFVAKSEPVAQTVRALLVALEMEVGARSTAPSRERQVEDRARSWSAVAVFAGLAFLCWAVALGVAIAGTAGWLRLTLGLAIGGAGLVTGLTFLRNPAWFWRALVAAFLSSWVGSNSVVGFVRADIETQSGTAQLGLSNGIGQLLNFFFLIISLVLIAVAYRVESRQIPAADRSTLR